MRKTAVIHITDRTYYHEKKEFIRESTPFIYKDDVEFLFKKKMNTDVDRTDDMDKQYHFFSQLLWYNAREQMSLISEKYAATNQIFRYKLGNERYTMLFRRVKAEILPPKNVRHQPSFRPRL